MCVLQIATPGPWRLNLYPLADLTSQAAQCLSWLSLPSTVPPHVPST